MCESTGVLARENRDLEQQIENERGKNIQSNLDQITKDLQEITLECDKLEYKIKLIQEGGKEV